MQVIGSLKPDVRFCFFAETPTKKKLVLVVQDLWERKHHFQQKMFSKAVEYMFLSNFNQV